MKFAPEKTWIHAFTDGRDVSPHSAVHDLAELPFDRIATVAGRYYAMDRDKRWDRTERALRAIVNGEGEHADDPIAAVQASYDRGITDEFIEPVVIDGRPRLDPERDTAIFFNFRPDRTRQLSEKLGELGVDLTTMTRYRDDFDFPVAFPEHSSRTRSPRSCRLTASVSSTRPRPRSTHTSRTSSTAAASSHSPARSGSSSTRRATSELRPQAARCPPARSPTGSSRAIEEDGYGFVVVNFANPDMVGHTGVIPAVVQAVETADECLGRVVEAVDRAGGVAS